MINMKKFKKTKIFLLSFIFSLFFALPSYADDFNNLDINVEINKEGIASVEETWDTVDQSGTEKYKPIENLGEIQIEDFKAKVNGKSFTEENPWNVDRSFDQKAYKYGINYTDNGLELCWGISNYGHNIHEISYKINPLVIELNDYDMVYWKFINDSMDPEPDKATIRIKGFEPFNDQVKMWGFGMEGDINNEDGQIVMESDGDIAYGVVMLRFPKGYFSTSYKIDKNFKDYADMAIEGSDWEDNQGGVNEGQSNDLDGSFIPIIFSIFAMFMAFVFGIVAITNKSAIMNRLDKDKKLPKAKDLKDQYFQEVPYENPIEDLYIFTKKAYSKIKQDDFLNAFILKWIYQGNIEIREDLKGIFPRKSQAIIIKSIPENMGDLESSFFKKLQGAKAYAQHEQIDQKAFEKYIRKHSKEMETFFDKFEIHSSLELEKKGYLVSRMVKKLFGKVYYLDPTQSGIELYSNLIKFKNYLEDYSLIKERDLNEVKLWDYFMIYAAMYGISDEVFKNLQKAYPEYETNSIYTYNTIMWSRSYASSVSTSYNDFISAGSGGPTSFGGGGGSFGGGSGGGSR